MIALLVGLFALVFACNAAVSLAYRKKDSAVVSLVIAILLILLLHFGCDKPL